MPGKVVIFGANGAVGRAVMRQLTIQGEEQIVAVSRSGKIQDLESSTVSVVQGDVLDAAAVKSICEGASAVICSIGLPYDRRVWREQWPVAVSNMLKATPASAVFVFVDNLYMFGPEAVGTVLRPDTPFTNSALVKPSVRAALDRTILNAHSRQCSTVIVRASDFYGPGVTDLAVNSGDLVFGNILRGGVPAVLLNMSTLHTFTYVEDFGLAVVTVMRAQTAWGRAWHVPSAPAVSVGELVNVIYEEAGIESARRRRPILLRGLLFRMACFFVPVLSEVQEMQHIWNNDFLVDHSDFSEAFPDVALPTDLRQGVQQTIRWYKDHHIQQR
jgi:nucleoside-diphosphate-sugar epimerase